MLAYRICGVPQLNVVDSSWRRVIVCMESRVGKRPITVPSNVKVVLQGQDLKVSGPLGVLSRSYPRQVKLQLDESGAILRVSKTRETLKAHQMHGLFRTLTDNMMLGVTVGFEKRLQLVGVGYKVVLEGRVLLLSLGFSHLVKVPVPDDLNVIVPESTKIVISGIDKCNVGLFAATIRRWRPPEPYKGKGVRYEGEVIKLKKVRPSKK